MFSHWSSHRVTLIRTLVTRPTLVAEQVTAHFVDPRVAACTHCTAEERACLFQAVKGGEEIYLRPSDPSLFNFIVPPWHPSAISSVLYLRDAAGNNAGTRTGAYIHYGDAASFHEWEFRTPRITGNLVINTSKLCPKSATDCVVTPFSRHKKLASIICAKLLTEDHAVLTR